MCQVVRFELRAICHVIYKKILLPPGTDRRPTPLALLVGILCELLNLFSNFTLLQQKFLIKLFLFCGHYNYHRHILMREAEYIMLDIHHFFSGAYYQF